MRIAVIADTHGRLPELVVPQLAKADEIWHLGDFCDLAMLEEVRRIGPPVEAVRGNNDYDLDLPISRRLERGGRSFYLIHIPPQAAVGTDVLIHGHTHVPRDEMLAGTRFLNPGSIGKPNKSAPASFAWLDVSPEGELTWEIVRV